MCGLKHSKSHIVHVGFTLVEMAVVLVVLGFVMSIGISTSSVAYESRDRSNAQDLIEDAADAVLGYALRNGGRLPRPSVDINGDENTAACDDTRHNNCVGYLPWRTLGTRGLDSFDNYLRYKVYYDFANPNTNVNRNNSDKGFEVTYDARGREAANPPMNIPGIAFAILSPGKRNKKLFQANSEESTVCNPHPGERDNANPNYDGIRWYYANYVMDDNNACYDDIVLFYTSSKVLARLSAFGTDTPP